ncbi:MAG: flavodoxin domain-containing protein [Faecalibacterium prausnitzii]|uniref:flavodoxin domain-containing protein n=1 Tax=Faecalibacterium prausnitzii TaxID=853 RepID=UPI003A4B9AEA
MVLYFTGTGNSRYLARRIAEGLEMPLYDLNACIKAGDTAPVQTGRDVVLVTPTYAWRIPRVVSEWLGKTELTGAECICYCPKEAIEYGEKSKGKPRYHVEALEKKQKDV